MLGGLPIVSSAAGGGGLGEGSLCGRVVEGFMALFCGSSLGGSLAAFCSYASWLAWWWISGVSMGILSSLLSISGLRRMFWRCYETHRFACRRLARFRGPPFEGTVGPMFGGGLYVLVLELDDALGELVLRLGWTSGVLWRISRRLLEFFEELEGVGWRLRLW